METFLITMAAAGIFLVAAVAIILRGWVLSILWGWFAVPIFGLPPLGVAQAIAIALVVGMLTHQYVPSKDGDFWGVPTQWFITPFLYLGVGWVVKNYV